MNYCLIKNRLNIFLAIVVLGINAHAQNPSLKPEEDLTWWYVILGVLVVALAGTVLIWTNKKKSTQNKIEKKSNANKDLYDDNAHDFDADEEMEWLRKNKKITGKSSKTSSNRKSLPQNSTKPAKEKAVEVEIPVPLNIALLDKSEPPIFEFKALEPAAKAEPLPLSNDESLLNAIEQSQDEYEEDEEIRDLALRILMAFRTRNSVEALSQVAIYDLSSAVRSKAVSILSEFDHESVFEAVLLACADPTREVRAAAARAFSRLSFDRADAWVRIIETGEQGRMIHAARAAIEGGFVERSFDRLTHRDKKLAYEAFALVALLIEAGETQQILKTIQNHRDKQVKQAIIHVLSVVKNKNAMSILYGLLEDKQILGELKKEIDNAMANMNLATA